jgi:putative transposase
MVAFIDDHREEHGVEPICEVLPIAPSTYYAHKAAESDPDLRSCRAKRDEYLRREIRRVWEENLRCTASARFGGSLTAKAYLWRAAPSLG